MRIAIALAGHLVPWESVIGRAGSARGDRPRWGWWFDEGAIVEIVDPRGIAGDAGELIMAGRGVVAWPPTASGQTHVARVAWSAAVFG